MNICCPTCLNSSDYFRALKCCCGISNFENFFGGVEEMRRISKI